MPVYVVTKPDSIKGIYETWAECKAQVTGVAGAVYQKVEDRDQAVALLEGRPIVLSPGLHVFTDGNHHGGVGAVVVWMGSDPEVEPVPVTEIATSVDRVFRGEMISLLDSDESVDEAIAKSGNVLAELGGLYLALWQAPEKAALKVVHDYQGVSAWLEGRWRAKDPVVKAIVERCRDLVAAKKLTLEFIWQRGHTSTWAGRNDFAKFNNRADELATKGAGPGG